MGAPAPEELARMLVTLFQVPHSDEPEEFVLRLGDVVQVETSVFLHRLRDVPYATYRGSTAGPARSARPAADDAAGGIAALTRVREAWQA